MCNRYFQFLTIGLIIFGLAGCRGDSPVVPDEQSTNPGVSANNYASSNFLWGLWDVSIDPDTGDIEAVPLRTADFNANVVRFLQPPISPTHMLTIALGPGCEPSTGYWVIDVTLKHPFPSMNIFRGFDVRGIIMTEGDTVGIHDTSVRYRATDGTRLLNADGYTRWWNMQEFTSYGKIFGYTEGARSTPGFNATATVNPYKLFTDALDLESPVSSMVPELRASFWTGGMHTRRYEMQFDIDGGTPPIRFKYAVDASWSLPDPQFAPEYPINAYDLSANCQEPYLVDVPIFIERPYYENATSFGGDAVFLLTIGDWQADSGENVIDQISQIWVESPTLIDAPINVLPIMEFVESTHATQATYRVTIPDCHPTGLQDQYFLITVESAAPDSYIPQIQGDPYAFNWPDAKLAGYVVVGVPVVELQDNFAWLKHAGGLSNDWGRAITTLSDDSTVVTGYYCSENAIFGEGEPNETILESEQYCEVFIARYHPDGSLFWAKRTTGNGCGIGHGITALTDDSTVVTGDFSNTITFGEGEPNETVLVTNDEQDMFVAKYNSEGMLMWAKRAGGIDNDGSQGVTSLSNSSAVVIGGFRDTAIFGEGEPGEISLNSYGDVDLVIARYNPDGTLAWAKQAGGGEYDAGIGITSLSDDSTIVTGCYMDSATFGMNEPNETILDSVGFEDIFIAKYNPDGSLAWAKSAGGPNENDTGFEITALPDNTIALTGRHMESAIFGAGEPNETVLESEGYFDIFVARYNADGEFLWAKNAGGPDIECGLGITALSNNCVAITGYFRNTATFGKGEPNETSLVTADPDYNYFLAEYYPDGSLAWAKREGGTGNESGQGITSLSDDSTVVAGDFYPMTIFGEGQPNETVLYSYGQTDIFIARYLP